MRGDFFDFEPQFTLIVSGNHKPILRDVTPAIKERLHLIPFRVQFDGERRDADLLTKLIAEWPGILAWAIEGCLMWQAIGGLNPPVAVQDATGQYLAEQDVFEGFIFECCTRDGGAFERTSTLLTRFNEWVVGKGETPRSDYDFRKALESRGFVPGKYPRANDRSPIMKGLRLQPPKSDNLGTANC
jgi:putative DNA primase/helicase